MITDENILAYAHAFVNAIQAHQRARVPAMKFSQWQLFISVWHPLMNNATN